MRKLLLLLACLYAGVAGAVVPDALQTKDNMAILGKAESLLNSFTTMRSRFTQFSSKDGDYLQHGDFYLSRPNKMRLVYDEPSQLEFVADGYYLIYHDKSFDQVSYLEINQTPAAILLKPDFSFSDPEFTVTDIQHDLDEYRITAIKTNEEELGQLTLVLSDKPVALKQWDLVDAKGIKSTVGLYEIEENVKLDPKLFVFTK
ncbi:MAG: outer membrane lipoprotein carrier protein LolA [Alphaproteobacteria bacterium]|nr:outer membrane lipoprotein carrier protein LolA [Alphaproteobacteria bacterium]